MTTAGDARRRKWKRSAQHLDTVTEEPAGGLWDADITDEVIRLYEEKYPVPRSA